LMLRADVHYFLLANEDDGLYNAGGGLVRRPYTMDSAKGAAVTSVTNDRNVGTEIDLTAKYIFNRYANVQFGYSHFFAGDFIDDTGPDEDIDFFYSQLGFTF
jgi:hypothetical protein